MIGVFLCFMVVLFPLDEVQIYSRRYVSKLACDGVMKECFKFMCFTHGKLIAPMHFGALVPSATI